MLVRVPQLHINSSMKKWTKKERIYDADGNLTHKQCGVCGATLPVASNFYSKGKVSKTNIDGYSPDCIVCHKAKWHVHAADPEKRKRWLLERIRAKCKKNNIPFDLDINDLVIPTHCPILGMPLSFGVKKISEYRNRKQGVP